MDEKMRKKGQIAIWVILAIVLVGVILLFVILERSPLGGGRGTFDPKQFIRGCVQDAITEAADLMMPQGGFVEPMNYKVYSDIKIEYLCKSSGFYRQCINQHPMFISEINDEIKSHIAPRVSDCFEQMSDEVQRAGGSAETSESPAEIEVSTAPGTIVAELKKEITVTDKDGTIQTFDGFDVRIASPIYNLASIALLIANSESKDCYFENVVYMMVDPTVDIRKFVMSDATKIYTIQDIASGKRFNTAIQGCVMPAGGFAA